MSEKSSDILFHIENIVALLHKNEGSILCGISEDAYFGNY